MSWDGIFQIVIALGYIALFISNWKNTARIKELEDAVFDDESEEEDVSGN